MNKLPSRVGWADCFRFPVQNETARREIWKGGLWFLFLPPFGWILNLGNRLNVVRRVYRGQSPVFTDFEPLTETFCRGCVSAGTIFSYLFPGLFLTVCSGIGLFISPDWRFGVLACLGFLLFALGMFCLPGCMVVYACEDRPEVLLQPLRALRLGVARGAIYRKAWLVALSAIGLSVLASLFFGLGFFFASVWAWQVAGYAFTIGIYGSEKRAEFNRSPHLLRGHPTA